jgi:hypothetical protein
MTKNMEHNVGSTDQSVRVLLGAVLGAVSLGVLVGAVPLPGVASPVLGIAAAVLLATGAMGTCGLYSALGISTN